MILTLPKLDGQIYKIGAVSCNITVDGFDLTIKPYEKYEFYQSGFWFWKKWKYRRINNAT
jgi:hypothetical protein